LTWPDGALLDALFVVAALENALNEDSGRVDFVGGQFSGLHEVLDFGDRDFASGGHHRIEVAGSAFKYEVAHGIAFPSFDDGKIRSEPMFQEIIFAVKFPNFLAISDFRAIACGRVKRGNARATCPYALCERALRNQIDFQFAREQLPFKFGIFPYIAADHLFNLPRFEHQSDPKIIDTRIVGDASEAFGTLFDQCCDAIFWNSAQPKSAKHEGHAVLDVFDGLFGA
jgi:hypothetical protein